MAAIKNHYALPVGTMVQEYRILDILGSGGFGIVYKAENKYFSEIVALKEFLPTNLAYRSSKNSRVLPISSESRDAYQWARSKFLKEAKTLRELGIPDRHPNIVQVRQFIEANNSAYMVMDFEEGRPFAEIIKERGPLKEVELKEILHALLDGLERVHGASVWHRDIKPSNILIRPDGSPVLIDFGAARKEVADSDRSTIAVFSPAYAAAEQIYPIGEQGPWTDIFALGMTFYRAIAGTAPTGAGKRLQGEEYVKAVEAAKGRYSPSFLAAIDAALGLHPEDRPQSIFQWKALLEAKNPVAKAPEVRSAKTAPVEDRDTDDDDETVAVAPSPQTTVKQEFSKYRILFAVLFAAGIIITAIWADRWKEGSAVESNVRPNTVEHAENRKEPRATADRYPVVPKKGTVSEEIKAILEEPSSTQAKPKVPSQAPVDLADNQGNIPSENAVDEKKDVYKARTALVVGVEHYDYWPERSNAIRAARDLSWELRRLGFAVVLVTDPTSREMKAVLTQLVKAAGKEMDQGVIIYYCGHTQTFTAQDGRKTGWLVPKDAPLAGQNRQGFMHRALSSTEISTAVRRIHAKHLLFLIDAPFLANDFQPKPVELKAVTRESFTPVHQFIAPGDSENIALKGIEFNKILIKGLQGDADLTHDGVISGSELGVYLSDGISKISGARRHIQFGDFAGTSASTGDFLFSNIDQRLKIARLFVDPLPQEARVQIVNIIPKFKQGIELPPGEYRLHVSAQGYKTMERKIVLAAGEDRTLAFELPKEKDIFVNGLGMRFVKIKAGSFVMGSPSDEPGRSNDEIPHRVKLTHRFFIQDTEVTVEQFRRFAQSTGYKTEAQKSGGCWITGKGNRWKQDAGASWEAPGSIPAEGRLPVVCVTWNDAVEFSRWLSKKEGKTYRLPTEAQWEYAARAGTSTPFSSGNCLSSASANFAKLGHKYRSCSPVFSKNRGRPVPAGTLAPNPWKIFNMHGNISEWCQDWYGPYPSADVSDPVGSGSGGERIMRGGHWQDDAAACRSANRRRFPPDIPSDVVGFRLVLIP